jgi:hypothetical protein
MVVMIYVYVYLWTDGCNSYVHECKSDLMYRFAKWDYSLAGWRIQIKRQLLDSLPFTPCYRVPSRKFYKLWLARSLDRGRSVYFVRCI